MKDANDFEMSSAVAPDDSRLSNDGSTTGKMDRLFGTVKLNLQPKQIKDRWKAEAREVMGTAMASIYSTLLVSVYMAFSFTELTKFPENKDFLEIYGFFTYLYFVGTVYLLYILCYIIRSNDGSDPKVVENIKSHGSVAVRLGVIIFGIGALAYYSLELLRFGELLRNQGPCFHPTIGINTVLALVFTFLQAYIIFTYPRLNLQCNKLLNRFGTMHLVALNIIIWIRTLIKESLEEIVQFEEEDAEAHKGGGLEGHDGVPGLTSCNSLLKLLEAAEREEEICNEYRHNVMGKVVVAAIPYLYPFMIEYALIGASVALIMSKHIGKPKDCDKSLTNIRKPCPKSFLHKIDFGHSSKGFICGVLILIAAVVNLTTFFGLDGHEHVHDEAELLSKVSNSVFNSIGLVACMIGIERIQLLQQKTDVNEDLFDLDEVLLRFGSVFSFLYNIFTIITGAFNSHVEDFPNGLHILNGVVEIIQIVLQLIFIHNLKEKELSASLKDERPGRQITIFLFLFNVAQWLVFTFEIQKVRASMVEANFYGFMPWVIIRRVTLPLAVFFRFHSSVVSIELWKEVYRVPEHELPINSDEEKTIEIQ